MPTLLTATLVITGVCTWYGGPFVGEHHAAHWNGETPLLAPDRVTLGYPGVAASVAYRFGEVLLLTRLDTGVSAYGVVLDRRRRNGLRYTRYFDAWPALARRLGFGPKYKKRDPGVVSVRVERTGWILGTQAVY